MKRKIIGFLICILLIASIFVSSLNASTIQTIKRDSEDIFLSENVNNYILITPTNQITSANLSIPKERLDDLKNKINDIIEQIEEEELKMKLKDIVSQIITENGEINTEAFQNILHDFYKNSINKVIQTPNEIIEESIINSSSGVTVKVENPPDAFTRYEAPFDNCFDWAQADVPDTTYASSGSNKYSGAIGARAGAIVGGARAESRQLISFYVGKKKNLILRGEIDTFGGKLLIPPASIASSHITMLIDNDVDDLYFMNDISPAFGWDWWVDEFLWFMGSVAGYGGSDVDAAMKLLDFVNQLNKLKETLDEVDNVETHTIEHSFDAEPGWHTVAIGVRTDAAAVVFGTAHVARAGRTACIDIVKYARPDTPIVWGPGYALVGTTNDFHAESEDFYDDDLQYKFDWGDGDISDWSKYQSSGSTFTMSHKYTKSGTYTIKVKARDIDLLESDWGTHEININDNNPPCDPYVDYVWHGFPDLYGELIIESDDPEYDQVYYGVDWSGGNTVDDWYGPYSSGYTKKINCGDKTGKVNVIAKDEHGALSGWTSENMKERSRYTILPYSLLADSPIGRPFNFISSFINLKNI